MALTPGSRLGPYEILAPLGAGGMGEVYRARDTKLHRDVVIKTLRRELASDPDRVRRFEYEAQSASALNHPNIITIHDIGRQDGNLYIAMEFVDGVTLREILANGEHLPNRRTLDLSTQIADGLARAHAAGIVHRDLKPENVMVSKDGFVKILDFGLAKLAPLPAEGGSALPTAVIQETHPGTVLGTVGYMSPEQASGRPLDYRSDQFSFGSVMYEMATGKRAFRRDSAAETLTAIIREEPEPIAPLNPKVPAPLRWILERCLAKEPDDRYASTRDLARDLRSLRDHLSETSLSAEAVAVPSRPRRRMLLPGVAAIALAALAVGFLLGKGRGGTAPQFQRLTFRRGTVLSARFAPDGQTVLYAAAWEGRPPEIFSARIGSPESRSMGLPRGDVLAVSPAGELAFSLGWRYVLGWEARGTLARVPIAGGAPREVLEEIQDADWSPDGSNLVVARQLGDRRVLEYPIGKRVYETAGWLSNVRMAPDGRRIAVVEHLRRGDSAGRLLILDAAGRSKPISGAYSSCGLRASWSLDGDLWSSRCTGTTQSSIDLYRLTPGGRERLVMRAPGGSRLEDISRDGRVLFARSSLRREIVGLAPADTRERSLSWLDWSFPTDLSMDGSFLLFDEQTAAVPDYLVYLRKTNGSDAVLLGRGSGTSLSPDGKWALVLGVSAPNRLMLLPTGPGEARPLVESSIQYQWANWFPDGRRVLAVGNEFGHGQRLWIQELGEKPRAISPEGVSFFWKALSPDGKRIAALGPDRKVAIYFVDPREPQPVAGLSPDDLPIQWTADGRALYVWRQSELPTRVYVVDVETGKRELWKQIDPPDPAGILTIGPILISFDGKSYVYSYRRDLDDLFLAQGLR
ncbi:MAG TPA: protein kinase [Thermoanaerobaculia bacterium]|nr:protein kinase [Thermoanaerobaculia bacterium]